ncbi:MAG: sulfurtransferase [Steroidobacteraceae bacterium]
MFKTLIEPEQLHAHLGEPDWAIIDCRFELAKPDWGEAAWATGHVPHALYAHLDRDLSGVRTGSTGRHPLPAVATLAGTFSRFGIDSAVQVIAYDQGSGVYAARLWWLLRWLGHRRAAVLNGGFAAWERARLPVSHSQAERAPRQFTAVAATDMLTTSAAVVAALAAGKLASGETLLVDARSAARFAGENETLDAVAGHIPGARNHPFTLNNDAQGRFLPGADLRRSWERTLRGRPATALVAMCGSGVTACQNLLALEAAGFSGARLYAGSWSEWIRDPARAVARGPEQSR